MTKEERDKHIRRYAELIEIKAKNRNVGQSVPRFQKAAPGQKGVAQQVAEETGLSKRTMERAQHTAKRAEVVKQKKELSAELADKSEPHRPNKGQVDFVKATAKKTGRSKASIERDQLKWCKLLYFPYFSFLFQSVPRPTNSFSNSFK